MSTRRTSAFLVCLLLVTLMEEAKPVLGGKGGGKFSKLSNRVKELEESMEKLGECKEVCSMISELKERLTAVEGEIEELKKEPPTNPPPLAPECEGYKVLDSADRKNTYGMGNAACDNDIEEAWYRFTGAAGSKMPESPPNKNTCGTHAPGWLNGRHPSVAEGKVSRQVCFNWDGNNCNWQAGIEVRNCDSFFVYKLVKSPGCQLRYCGSD
ncbi:pancreatic secretory granule membrane major glycoprotein GP2-like [Pocillopora verrucosa]